MLHLALRRGWLPPACLDEVREDLSADPAGLLARLASAGVLDSTRLAELEATAASELELLLEATQDGRRDPDRTRVRQRDPGDFGPPVPPQAQTGDAPGSTAPSPAVGPRIGPYQVLGLLGEGGMGQVFKALDPALGREVALKVLHRSGLGLAHTAARDLQERFFREARAQARVEHPFVAKVHEMGEWEGQPFIAMQYVEGLSLVQGLEGRSLEARVRTLAEVCEGVHAAHRLGIIHRDLKPGNILVEVDADGHPHPVVLDFGLAFLPDAGALTLAGAAMGTPRYMSPEQVQGRALDRRTDVYSLGVTFFEVLCGRPPFEGDNPADLLLQVMEREPIRPSAAVPDLPRDLETILLKCLEKAPAHRYDSARALGEDLRRFLDGEPIQARPASRLERLWKWIGRNRAVATVAAVSLLLLLGTAGFAGAMVARSRAQARAAAFFNRESERQEALLARTYGMPVHDVTPTEDRVRSDLQRLQQAIADLGRDAEGPGHLALGRAHRLLGDLEEAHGDLARAWASGFQTPEAAEELGLAKAALYRRLLAPLTGQERMERQRDLEERYRRPALDLLHFAQSSAPGRSSNLARAELALTEEHFGEALTLARQARESQGWLYESHVLEAEIHMLEALRASDGRRHEEAEALLARAGEALDRARDIGRSAPAVYLMEARRRAQLLRTRVEAGQVGAGHGLRTWALEACREARRVRSRTWEASACEALVHLGWAPHLGVLGEDPRPELQAGIAAADQALQLRPGSNETLDALAFLWWRVAMVEQLEGRDPRSALGQALGTLGRAFRDPGLAHHLHHRMGLCHIAQALYDLQHGMDPEPAVALAERHLLESHRLKSVGQPLSDLLWALGIRARMAAWRGEDLAPILRQAEDLHTRCRVLIPRYFFAQTNLADIALLQAEVLLGSGKDPGAEIRRSETLGRAAREESPGLPYASVVLGRAAMLRGLHAGPGQGAEAAFEAARREFEAATRLRPHRVDFLRWPLLLRLARLQAAPAWEGAAYRRLQRDLAEARRAHPQDPELVLLEAQLEGEAARRLPAAARPAHQARAQAEARRAEALNANLRPWIHRLGLR